MGRDAVTDPGFMVASRRRAGKVRWRQTRTLKPGWGTPIVIRAGDCDELIVEQQPQDRSLRSRYRIAPGTAPATRPR